MNSLIRKFEQLLSGHECEVTPEMEAEWEVMRHTLEVSARHMDCHSTVFDLNQGIYRLHPFMKEGLTSTKEIMRRILEKTHPDDRFHVVDTEMKGYEYLQALPPEKRNDFRLSYQRRYIDGEDDYQICLHCCMMLRADAARRPWLLLTHTEKWHYISSDPFNPMCQCLPFPPEGAHYPHYHFKRRPYFTTREKQMIELKEKGCTISEIADILDIDINTVKAHQRNLLKKINAPSMHIACPVFAQLKIFVITYLLSSFIDLLSDFC